MANESKKDFNAMLKDSKEKKDIPLFKKGEQILDTM